MGGTTERFDLVLSDETSISPPGLIGFVKLQCGAKLSDGG